MCTIHTIYRKVTKMIIVAKQYSHQHYSDQRDSGHKHTHHSEVMMITSVFSYTTEHEQQMITQWSQVKQPLRGGDINNVLLKREALDLHVFRD